jgi:hypothetical protein
VLLYSVDMGEGLARLGFKDGKATMEICQGMKDLQA